MHKSLGITLFLTAVLGLSLLSLAQAPAESILKNAPTTDDYPGMEGVCMLDEGIVTSVPHGTSTYVVHQRLCLLTHEGIKDYGEVQIPYDSETEKIHLDYARTITPDGREVIPNESAIHEVTLPAAQDAPMYSSIKLYTISMPALEPGAIIDYQVTIKDTQTYSEEEESDFSGMWCFAWGLPVQTSCYVVHVPKELPIRWQVKGVDLAPTVQTDSDTVTYTFLRNDIPAIGYEPYMPDFDALSPLAVVTSFADWNEVAAWYNDLAADRVQTDSDIVAKVNELTAGVQTPSDKISAIYDFVARKVRYVAIEFGLGGYQPHPAPKTFANRYGDCKDQATLLITMLRTAGFEAYPVLLRVGSGVDVDFDLPPAVQMFNHVIVAVRQGDGWLFLDPTYDLATSSYLPQNDQAHHGLLVLGDEDQPGLIVTTDPFVPEKTYVKSETHATISPDGDLEATAKIKTGGDDDLWYRSILIDRRPDERKDLFGQILSAVIPRAQLTEFDYSDLDDTHTAVTVTEGFKKDHYVQKAGGMFLFPAPYPAQIPFPSLYSDEVGQDSRTYPLMISPERIETRTWITIPAGMTVQLPEDTEVTNEIASFSAHYSVTEGKILAIRVLQVNTNEVSPEKYSLYKQVIDAMLEDANAMIVARPTG